MAELAGYGGNVIWGSVVSDGGGSCANSWSLDVNLDTHDITDFCSAGAWRDFLAGLKGWTATVEVRIDGAKPVNVTSLGTSAALDLYMVDGGANYAGTAILNSISPSVSVDAEETYTLGFQGTGALAYSDA